MILISHRGNIVGRNFKRENSPSYIQEALDAGYFVEMDVLHHDGEFLHGHEWGGTRGKVDPNFLSKNHKKLLIHCKDRESILFCAENLSTLNYFYHERDDFTFSSYMWTIAHSRVADSIAFNDDKFLDGSVCMLPEKYGLSKESVKNCFGVCSDIISFYK
jgi:hypothetical protein